MNDETLVVLMTPPRYLPLYWVRWDRCGVVCHLFNPDNAELRQRVVDTLLARQPVPCLLRHPVEEQWYHFDAYVGDINVGGTQLLAIGDIVQSCAVTLVPTGPLLVLDMPWTRPPRLRAKRRDAGQPRRKTRVPVAAQAQEG